MIKRDTGVTPGHPATDRPAGTDRYKIRISVPDGAYHTNHAEILTQNGFQTPSQSHATTSTPASTTGHHRPACRRPQGATRRRRNTTVTAPAALYRIPDVMEALNLSRSKIYELIKAGRLDSVKEGRARLIPAEAIVKYARLLVSEATGGDR